MVSGNDNDSQSLTYTIGIDVYLNGSRLNVTDDYVQRMEHQSYYNQLTGNACRCFTWNSKLSFKYIRHHIRLKW